MQVQMLNIEEVKINLSTLAENVALGASFIIERDGKLLAKVVPFNEKTTKSKRIGCLPTIDIPDDFDDLGSSEIISLFTGNDDEILA